MIIPTWYQTVVTQMLDALTFLHAKDMNILHRDLAPSNILFNDLERFVLADFSIARFSTANGVEDRVPFEYTPPEAHPGCTETTMVDIWSLGCLCLDMLNLLPTLPDEYRDFELMRHLGYRDVLCELAKHSGRCEIKMMVVKMTNKRFAAKSVLAETIKSPSFQARAYRPSVKLLCLYFRDDTENKHLGEMSEEDLHKHTTDYLREYSDQKFLTELLAAGESDRRVWESTRRTSWRTKSGRLQYDPTIIESLVKSLRELEQMEAQKPTAIMPSHYSPGPRLVGKLASSDAGDSADVQSSRVGQAVNETRRTDSKSGLRGSIRVENVPGERDARQEQISTATSQSLRPAGQARQGSRGNGGRSSEAVIPPVLQAFASLGPEHLEQISDLIKDVGLHNLKDIRLDDLPQSGAASQAAPSVSLGNLKMEDYLKMSLDEQEAMSHIPQLADNLAARGFARRASMASASAPASRAVPKMMDGTTRVMTVADFMGMHGARFDTFCEEVKQANSRFAEDQRESASPRQAAASPAQPRKQQKREEGQNPWLQARQQMQQQQMEDPPGGSEGVKREKAGDRGGKSTQGKKKK